MQNRKKNITFPYGMMLLGALSGVLVLLVSSQIPFTMLEIAGLLPASQLRANVAGYHWKHWITGFILIVTSILIYVKDPKLAKISAFVMGLGAALTLDEVDDINSFIRTGEL